VYQGLIGGPRQKDPNHVGVGDVGELIALLGEASDVLVESFIRLVPIVLEIPGVPRAYIGALEVTHKDLLKVRPTSNLVGREMLQPCTCQVGEVQGEAADDERITISMARLDKCWYLLTHTENSASAWILL
jgi:hypothetical protein